MPTRPILCLANSKKHGGRCVAGVSADGAGWVRAVSPRDDGTLFPADYQFADGSEPAPLDLVDIPFEAPRPRAHHPEDWLITNERWRPKGRPADNEIVRLLRPYIEPGPHLVRDTADRVSYASIEKTPIDRSLALVVPDALELYRKKTLRGAWLARGRFALAGARYDLALTDPVWVTSIIRAEQPTLIKPEGRSLLLTLSLSEMFEGCYFKLIATVLLVPEELGDRLRHGKPSG